MIPYPGESLRIYRAMSFPGPVDILADVRYRDGSSTLASGETWKTWFDAYENGSANVYLDDPGEAVVVSWVVEVLGGTGSLDASEGEDPTFSDDSVTTPTALGTIAVTGAGTYRVASTIVTPDVIVDPSTTPAYVLALDCTSGSVVVQQVKIEVRPVGGFLGAWSDVKPSFDGTAFDVSTKLYADANIEGEAIDADPETAWNLAAADFNGDLAAQSAAVTRTMSAFPPGACYASQGESLESLDPTYGAGMQLVPNLILLHGRDPLEEFPIDPGLVQEVDWIRPPTEVPGDTLYLVQQIGTGSTGWLDATVTFDIDTGPMPGGPSLASEAGEFDVVGGMLTAAITHAAESGAGPVGLATDGRDILVSISHSMALGDGMVWPGVTPGVSPYSRVEVINYYFGDVQSYATMPAYRVWDPTAVAQEPLRLMQRGDGLGMGSGRVLGVGTRQGSIRVFGSV